MLKNEKEKENKRNPECGRWRRRDESGDVKTKEKWFGKQNRKEDETKMNYKGGENKNDKRVWKLIFKTK